ncbi:MAG: hypothetical protein ACQEQL_01110 [Pseudomonadota bacterium]
MATESKGMSTGGMILIAVIVIGALLIGWAMASNDTGDNRLQEAAQELTEDDKVSIEAGDFEAEISE